MIVESPHKSKTIGAFLGSDFLYQNEEKEYELRLCLEE